MINWPKGVRGWGKREIPTDAYYTEKNSETRRCLEDVSKTMRRTGVSKLRRTGVSKYQGCLKNYEALAGLKTETRWRLISVSKASRKLWDTRASQLWDIRVSKKNSGCLKAVSKNIRRIWVSQTWETQASRKSCCPWRRPPLLFWDVSRLI